MPLALVRRFCLEDAGYAVAGYRWLSPASFSSTLIVCPHHQCVSGGLSPPRRASATASNVPRWLSALLLPLTGWFGQV